MIVAVRSWFEQKGYEVASKADPEQVMRFVSCSIEARKYADIPLQLRQEACAIPQYEVDRQSSQLNRCE